MVAVKKCDSGDCFVCIPSRLRDLKASDRPKRLENDKTATTGRRETCQCRLSHHMRRTADRLRDDDWGEGI